jgi:hypothetical protein
MIGMNPQSHGEVHVDSGTVELTSDAGAIVGGKGTGKLYVGSQDAPGKIHAASAAGAPVVVRATTDAYGLLQGWGEVGTGGALVNNGKVIGDGFNHLRNLDLSNFAVVNNTIDNPAYGNSGWFVQRGGSLTLPPIQILSGTHVYTWGENSNDPTLDLVNSMRFTVHDQPTPTQLSISLRTIATADPVDIVDVPMNVAILGLWHFSAQQFDPSAVDVTVRYNSAVVDAYAPYSSQDSLRLFASDGLAWHTASSLWVDPENKWIGGDFNGGVKYVAVAFDGSGNQVVVSVPQVPEPAGLFWLGAAFLLVKRCRKSACP